MDRVLRGWWLHVVCENPPSFQLVVARHQSPSEIFPQPPTFAAIPSLPQNSRNRVIEALAMKKHPKEQLSWSLIKPQTGKRLARRPRFQKFPDWSVQELLVLVNEVAAVETVTMSSYQKWKLISDNCHSLGVSRSLNHCRTKWEHLLHEYKLIKHWEFQSGISYWSLDQQTILLQLGLPLSFDKDLFLFIDDNVNAPAAAAADSDPDFKFRGSSGYKKKRRCQHPQDSKNDKAPEVAVNDQADQRKHQEQEEMVLKLREQADLIHAILKGDTDCSSFNELKSPEEVQIEKRRWQGSELIKIFGCLVGNIEQLSYVVQQGR